MTTKPEAKHDSQARMKRGLELLESDKSIFENADGSFQVPSQTSSKSYEVRLIGQSWVCTCPDFEYRQVDVCKHIFAVRMMIATKTYLKDEPKPKVFAEDAIPCDRCGSIRVIRFGYDSGKQTFYCKDCKHKFRQPSLLKAKFSPELVTLTLDLYFSGLSLRKIARSISDHFNVDINYSTIYTWIQKYIPIISDYINSLAPQLSKEWHADELFVNVRGGTHQGREKVGFVWNIMDRETRFLIASKLTANRSWEDCVSAFQQAAANAHGLAPDTVYTDSLRAYSSGVNVFQNAKRVENCGIAKRQTNNRIERMNGTLRERVKVQRGWKTAKTPLAEGNRIQYNFVKPHMALEGKTPAEAGGIKIEGNNKWLRMLKTSLNKTQI